MASLVGHILGFSHIIVGAGAIIAPFHTARLFQIVPAASTTFISRAFGSRDLVFGIGIQLYEPKSPERRTALLACGVAHALDVINGVVTYAQGYLPFETMLMAAVIDVTLVGVCWWESGD